jgi:hypothetical protein
MIAGVTESDRQLTRHGRGLSSAIGVVFEVICNRCILPLGGFG